MAGTVGSVETLLAVAVLVGIFGVVPGALVLLTRRVRRRGLGGGFSLMGAFDVMWNPAAFNARMEARSQEERPAAAPLPGNRLF
jgi:hypothetical protein